MQQHKTFCNLQENDHHAAGDGKFQKLWMQLAPNIDCQTNVRLVLPLPNKQQHLQQLPDWEKSSELKRQEHCFYIVGIEHE